MTDPVLSTQMKSVGEVMAIGRTFKESLNKALRSLEIGVFGLSKNIKDISSNSTSNRKAIRSKLKNIIKQTTLGSVVVCSRSNEKRIFH